MSSNYNSQEDDIFEQLGLPAITVPKLLRSPLPLQCLAAEALSDEWKQEIEQLTDSSIKELKKGSPVPSIGSCKSHSSAQRDSGTGTDEMDCELLTMATDTTRNRETTVSVPLQFFSSTVGLRIIGGVKCLHSNERHAKIMYVSGRMDRENIPEQVAALHGRCILDFNGQSLRGKTFENVRKTVMETTDILVNLTLTDCSEDPSNPAAISNSEGVTRELPPPVKIRLNQQALAANKRHMFRRRFSVGDINSSMRSHSNLHGTPPTSRGTPSTSKLSSNTTSKGSLRGKASSTSDLAAVQETKVNNHRTSLGEVPSGIKEEEKETGTTDTPTVSPPPSIKVPTDAMASFSMDMPKGMIKLAFNYVKAHKTLYVSLFKVKFHSLTIGSEPSGCFFNTYILPDKREQGVKFAKIIPSNLPMEEVYSRSASYILTNNEVKSTSIRIIIWEQSGQSFGNKNFTFKGEVFLALNDEEVVNLHGVVQTYTIADPDPNLPKLPKAYYVSNSGGGKLMKKMMDSTLGVMTMKRRKKSGNNLVPVADVPKSGSLNNLVDNDTEELAPKQDRADIKKLLAPLKRQTQLNKTPAPLEAPLKEDPVPVMCSVMLRPATLDSKSSDERGMSLVDFLNTLDPDRPKNNKSNLNTTAPDPKPIPTGSGVDLGLPPKSPLSSSCHDLRPYQLSEPNKRRASAIVDGTQSFSRHQKERGSIHSLFDSFGRPNPGSQSTSAQASSRNSMLLSDSDLSSSVSSLSMDKQRDSGSNGQQSWAQEAVDEDGSCSEISFAVPQLSKTSEPPSDQLSTTPPVTSPLHNSIIFRPSPSPDPSYTSSNDSLRNDTRGGSESSYSCEQVPVLSSDPETFSSADSNHTVTVNTTMDSSTETYTETGPRMSPSLLSLSPATRNRLLPLNSTPKKPSHHVPQSKSMGNMSDMLFFMGSDEGGDSTSLSEFMERELSCLDTTSQYDTVDFMGTSQDSSTYGLSLSSSQREALECSYNSSSLDFSFPDPSPLDPSPPDPSHLDPSPSDPSLTSRHYNSIQYSKATIDNQSHSGGTDSKNHSMPVAIPKHKWSSLDDLQTSASTPTLNLKPAAKHSPRTRSHRSGLTEKLAQSYKNGKTMGTAKLVVEGLCVSSQIQLSIKDMVFFDQKLMNGEYSMRVNLYNSVNERCEKSLKGVVSLKKNHMEEAKAYTPSTFTFNGNPMMYHLQIILQLSNKLFGKRKYHVWINLKELISDSYNRTDWFNVVQLSL